MQTGYISFRCTVTKLILYSSGLQDFPIDVHTGHVEVSPVGILNILNLDDL